LSEAGHLERERRLAPLAAAAAFAAAVLLLIQTILFQVVVLGDRPDTDRGILREFDEHAGALLGSAVLQAFASIALVIVFWYLFRAIRARRPELPELLVYLVYAGPILYAAGRLLGVLDQIDVADEFVSSGPLTESRAEDLLDSPPVATIALSAAGGLTIAILYVVISLHAMRTGLLSRFTGILGIIVGALMVLPLLPGGSLIIEVFWLGALGVLFLGRWPGGRGPAWESGAAEPWLTSTQKRLDAAEAEAAAEQPEPEPPARRSSRKRKRR
jgi:hypothetical protein